MDQPLSTRVEIYGNEYNVRSDKSETYVKDVAAYVDSKMNEIAKTHDLVSSTKIGILAAMQIADELFDERRKREARPEERPPHIPSCQRLPS